VIPKPQVTQPTFAGSQRVRHFVPACCIKVVASTVDRTKLIPHPQSESANRRQSLWSVITAVPVGSLYLCDRKGIVVFASKNFSQ
jgi:hypothetical protein